MWPGPHPSLRLRPLPVAQYKLGARKQVRGQAQRALAALQAADAGAQQLSLERDVVPKLEVRHA